MASMFRVIFLFCFSFCFISGYTQSFVLTEAQNREWFTNLKLLPFEQQLAAINRRLVSDTNVFARQFYNDKIKVADSLANRLYGDGKPAIVIGGHLLNFSNSTQAAKVLELTEVLDPTFIKEVVILEPGDPNATALFGRSGRFGVILMNVKKAKYLKRVEYFFQTSNNQQKQELR